MLAFATEQNASSAPTVTMAAPQPGARRAAAAATGVRLPRSSSRGSTPTMTVVPRPYTRMAVPMASITPSGRLRSGFLISSETLATWVTPT
jgi:hypothetical protein